MSFDYRFYSLLLKKIRFQHKFQINSLTKTIDYFKHLAEKIPDEYLKASLVKFLSLKEKLGDYIAPILHKSHKVFDYQEDKNEDNLANNTNNNQKPSQKNQSNEEDLKKKIFHQFLEEGY